jgi:hypothetical protein
VTTGRLLAATTALLRLRDHLIDIRINCLLKVGDHVGKLLGDQPFIASGTNRVDLFEPTERLIDRFFTVGTIQGYL